MYCFVHELLSYVSWGFARPISFRILCIQLRIPHHMRPDIHILDCWRKNCQGKSLNQSWTLVRVLSFFLKLNCFLILLTIHLDAFYRYLRCLQKNDVPITAYCLQFGRNFSKVACVRKLYYNAYYFPFLLRSRKASLLLHTCVSCVVDPCFAKLRIISTCSYICIL